MFNIFLYLSWKLKHVFWAFCITWLYTQGLLENAEVSISRKTTSFGSHYNLFHILWTIIHILVQFSKIVIRFYIIICWQRAKVSLRIFCCWLMCYIWSALLLLLHCTLGFQVWETQIGWWAEKHVGWCVQGTTPCTMYPAPKHKEFRHRNKDTVAWENPILHLYPNCPSQRHLLLELL